MKTAIELIKMVAEQLWLNVEYTPTLDDANDVFERGVNIDNTGWKILYYINNVIDDLSIANHWDSLATIKVYDFPEPDPLVQSVDYISLDETIPDFFGIVGGGILFKPYYATFDRHDLPSQDKGYTAVQVPLNVFVLSQNETNYYIDNIGTKGIVLEDILNSMKFAIDSDNNGGRQLHFSGLIPYNFTISVPYYTKKSVWTTNVISETETVKVKMYNFTKSQDTCFFDDNLLVDGAVLKYKGFLGYDIAHEAELFNQYLDNFKEREGTNTVIGG
jgi:hypothetical protein